MKSASRILSLLLIVSAGLFYASCDKGGGDKKPEEQTQLEKLVSTWSISAATLDGTDRTADFNSLKLTLSGTFEQGGTYQYSFTGTRPNPSPWPVSGTWKFGDPVASTILRLNDNLTMNYAVNASQLEISFTCAACDFAGGRVNKVNGEWKFTFTK